MDKYELKIQINNLLMMCWVFYSIFSNLMIYGYTKSVWLVLINAIVSLAIYVLILLKVNKD